MTTKASMSGALQRRRRKLRKYLLNKFGDGTTAPCAGCGSSLTNDTLTIDRYPVPGKLGGQYIRRNVRPMCHPCNTCHVDEPSL